jgi:4a-hydroxytetrahydrobiopterin dehydratase
MTELADKRCVPCEGGVPPLDLAAAVKMRESLRPQWKIINEGKGLEATFEFRNYWRTTAFVNAVAWIAHSEDHHPDISFGFNRCTVRYWTHSINGLSENDFICAAKIDALLPRDAGQP